MTEHQQQKKKSLPAQVSIFLRYACRMQSKTCLRRTKQKHRTKILTCLPYCQWRIDNSTKMKLLYSICLTLFFMNAPAVFGFINSGHVEHHFSAVSSLQLKNCEEALVWSEEQWTCICFGFLLNIFISCQNNSRNVAPQDPRKLWGFCLCSNRQQATVWRWQILPSLKIAFVKKTQLNSYHKRLMWWIRMPLSSESYCV